VERAEYDFNLKTLALPQVESDLARYQLGSLMILSREKYARRREEVEADLFKEESVTETPRTENTREAKKERPPRERRFQEAKTETKETPREEPRVRPLPHSEPPSPGRGGQQHKYLQNLIKRIAEDKGYRATIEKEILGGIGKIDVALEKDGTRTIACEISVTTSVEHEIGNLQKCLAVGFEHVVLVSSEKKVLNSAKAAASVQLEAEQAKRLKFFSPEEFFSFLEEEDAMAAGKE
jgi:hypothetical protein